jgi:RNA recognition motif-containing protein
MVSADSETGASRQYGFVTFANPSDFQTVLDNRDCHYIDNRQVYVKLAESRYTGNKIMRESARSVPRPPSLTNDASHSRVFIGGISQTLVLEDLQQYFSSFGKVDTAVLSCHPGNGRPVREGVSTDSLKFHLGPPCPTLLRPTGGPPPKQPYSRLLPPWIPHAVRAWAVVKVQSGVTEALGSSNSQTTK